MQEKHSGARKGPTAGGGWRHALRAFRSRNYRLYFFGQGVSLVGTWMTRVATSWLVYRLTNSALLLGVVGFAGQIPIFFLAPFAGVWIDRLNRRNVLLITQVLSMIQSLWLAALVLSHRAAITDILLLSVFQGMINAFDMPARQAFLMQMLDKREDLPGAIALNSSMVNGSRLIGPSLAGLLIAGYGEGICFLIDGLSYLGVILSLVMMRITVPQVLRKKERVWTELREGWHYISRFAPIRTILLLMALVSLAGMPYTVLMPMVVGKTLHAGPNALGFLMGATGLGALFGALRLAGRKSVLGLGRVIPLRAAIFGAGLILFSLSRWLPLSMLCVTLVGYGLMQQMAASNTILQTIVDEDKRGRVMSYFSMAFIGTAPFGSMAAGFLADRIGAPATLCIGGVVCLAGAGWFLTKLPRLREAARPVYVRLGILPELATGVRSASDLQSTVER